MFVAIVAITCMTGCKRGPDSAGMYCTQNTAGDKSGDNPVATYTCFDSLKTCEQLAMQVSTSCFRPGDIKWHCYSVASAKGGPATSSCMPNAELCAANRMAHGERAGQCAAAAAAHCTGTSCSATADECQRTRAAITARNPKSETPACIEKKSSAN